MLVRKRRRGHTVVRGQRVRSGCRCGGSGGVSPRKKFVEATLQVAADELGDDVLDVALGFDVVEFARGDERGEDRPVLGSAFTAREEAVLSRQSQGPDRSL